MALLETWVDCYLGSLVKIQYLDGHMFSMDNQGNLVGVRVYDKDGNEANITGTVTAHVIRPDGNTVAVVGVRDGNKCYVTLPQAAYAYPGTICIILKLTSGSTITTLAGVVTNIYQSVTSPIVDPGTISPSIEALIAQIDAAVDSVPADHTSLWASFAPAFSSSASYAPGQYVTYDGGLYVCKTEHNGTWNASHFTLTNLGAGISDLKSAVTDIRSGGGLNLYNQDTNELGVSLNTSGEETANANFDTSDYIFLEKGTYIVRAFEYSGSNPLYRIYIFDTAKQFFKRETPAISNYPNGYSFTVNLDRYVRLVVPDAVHPTEQLKKVVLLEGSTASEYKPYYTAEDLVSRAVVPLVNRLNQLILYKEKAISPTITNGYYINASTGKLQSTQSAYSYTSPISVSKGDVVQVPKLANSSIVSNVAKVVVDGVAYISQITVNDMEDFGVFYVVDEDCQIAFSTNTYKISEFKIYESNYSKQLVEIIQKETRNAEDNTVVPNALKGSILYEADTLSDSGYICNAIAYADGTIIACRSNGKVVRIGYDGTEETLLTISGSLFDWRCLWMDSNENVYASPHASWGSMSVGDRGLYRLVKGENSMQKVISLYNAGSSVPTETQNNDDTIWTMCEDGSGNLYAGVYAHTVRANPAIYKSTDNGATWSYLINFNDEGLTTSGKHIHSVIYSEWQKALYCIVGEINTVFKSVDGGETWENLHVTLVSKGSAMCATPYGIFIGSDNAYNCDIDVLYNDDITHERVFRGWANTVFAIRCSDITGFLYAFTKIDSSVNSESYYPPVGALTDPDVIETWKNSVSSTVYDTWKAYYDSVIGEYPSDAIRPQHYGIIVSTDGGKNWKPLIRFDSSSESANGLWTTGYFTNGECLTGRMDNHASKKPIVISEGKHKYVSGGCDLSGEIFVRSNESAVVPQL